MKDKYFKIKIMVYYLVNIKKEIAAYNKMLDKQIYCDCLINYGDERVYDRLYETSIKRQALIQYARDIRKAFDGLTAYEQNIIYYKFIKKIKDKDASAYLDKSLRTYKRHINKTCEKFLNNYEKIKEQKEVSA